MFTANKYRPSWSNAVAPAEMGTASGINNMMQRFGAVFAVAIASSVFSAYGHLGSPTSVTDGFRPAIAVSALLSLLGAAGAIALKDRTSVDVEHEPAARSTSRPREKEDEMSQFRLSYRGDSDMRIAV